MLDRSEYFECACFSDEHTLKMTLDADPQYPDVYTSVFLNDYQNIFKRIWIAIKYIFGYKCKYGHWDCFTLQQEDADRMINLIQEYKKLYKQSNLPHCCEINENDLALRVAKAEGKKEQIDIAQIKEVQKIILEELAKEKTKGNSDGILKLISKHQTK